MPPPKMPDQKIWLAKNLQFTYNTAMQLVDRQTRDLSRLADIGWPPALPMELALHVLEPLQLKAAYEFTDEEWDALPQNEAFIAALTAAVDMVKREGASFKMRAQLLAEGNLVVAQQMLTDKSLPASVRKDLIVSMARWAGYDKQEAGAINASLTSAFQIQINLGV